MVQRSGAQGAHVVSSLGAIGYQAAEAMRDKGMYQSTAEISACRSCGGKLSIPFCNLGAMPLANRLVAPGAPQPASHPLNARVCDACFLVQLTHRIPPSEIFSDYSYFSSYSSSWLAHARRYCEMAARRFGLGTSSFVVEIASNDGYLLKNFVTAGIPCLGVEPAANVALAAEAAGVPTRVDFFGAALAETLRAMRPADLIVANNVLAHVPDLNDFAAGLAALLAPEGAITIEVPHLLRLIEGAQFDTVYHEHFSYFSLAAAERLFRRHGLRLFDLETLPTHGGSLRLYLCHRGASHAETAAVAALRGQEAAAGLDFPETYRRFQAVAERARAEMRSFIAQARDEGAAVACYGAAAKGITLLNYCGITGADIALAADLSPHKQGRLIPGAAIPIGAPEEIGHLRPAYVVVLPWNLREEIMAQLGHIRDWGGRFVIPVPRLEILG